MEFSERTIHESWRKSSFRFLEGCVSLGNDYSNAAMKLFFALMLAVSFCAVSCERHEFEGPDGTKQFHKSHAAGAGHGDEKGHGAGHDGHSEKKEAH
ncbi:MAG: hypothetical protein HC845_03035 [Akkermansiaceae bacterium]|nr:hypothetical protein [Akkermansiaceae bacterium]